jgi:(4S)-4-hydroxy-5-phosphonooxypentane-2,3-dione isomerase
VGTAVKQGGNVMLKPIMAIAAVALSASALLLLPTSGNKAAAESAPLFIAAVEYDVVPGKVDDFLAALKENAAASVKEPGCRELNVTVSQKDPNHLFIFEVYDNAAAAEAHTATEHFKKYKAATKDLVVKRQAQQLWSVSMNMKGM